MCPVHIFVSFYFYFFHFFPFSIFLKLHVHYYVCVFQDISMAERPFSPLMLASKNGHAKCVTLLLEKNADIRVVSDSGYNCLMESIDEGHQ